MGERQIVIGLGPVPAEVVEPVLGQDVDFRAEPSDEDRARAVGAIVRAASPVGADELAEMPQLRVIARTGVGYNLVDITAAHERGIPVAITPGSNTHAVAEGVFAHLLHLVKQLNPLTELVAQGRWEERTAVPVGDLEGAALGIVGYGRIGRRVHHLAEAFGMEVLAYDPVAEVPEQVRAESLEQLLRASDAVSLHVPLLPETRGLIGETSLQRMRPGAYLLNISRGGLVDEDAVLQALESGKLAGVGLDAFEPEPPRDHRLYHHRKVVLSPHVMGLSQRAARATFIDAAQAVRDVLNGGAPRAVVSP